MNDFGRGETPLVQTLLKPDEALDFDASSIEIGREILMLVGVETLKKLFDGRRKNGSIDYEGTCRSCGYEAKIQITRTSRGYGFQKGVLYEGQQGQATIECIRCYNGSNLK